MGQPQGDFEAVIGLETHIQLNTRSKIFCRCKADSWGDPPNVNICPICAGLPGVLPALNRAAVEKAVLLAAAMRAESIQDESYFARKNYFYPDLPKGYQISQYDEPLARGGYFDLPMPEGYVRRITIHKLHVEEDAGKTIYRNGARLIDFNRCGVPLVEMVTGPDLRSPDEAAEYLIRLRQLVRWIGVSEGDMERGHLRCDANVSIRPVGSLELNVKTEIKNLNSIEAVRAAVRAEIERQIRAVGAGGRIEPWTLNWDEDRGTLHKLRAKETEADYRYFREPDLLPILLDAAWRASIVASLPELPLARRSRFIEQYGLPAYDAGILTEERSLAVYYEAAVAAFNGDPKTISNWVMNEVIRMLKENSLTAGELKLLPEHLSAIVAMVGDGTITTNTGKDLLREGASTGRRPEELVRERGLAQVSDRVTLERLADEIVQAHPDQVETYRGGKTAVVGWFVGQLMARTQGKANPRLAREIFEARLAE